MREVRTLIWCDMHNARGEQEPATTTETVALSSLKKPRQLDLCETCEKELLGELRHALEELGLVVRGEPAALVPVSSEPLICRVPGCASAGREYASMSSLTGHVRAMHGMTVKEYRDRFSSADAPPSKRDVAAPVAAADQTCPECEAVYTLAKHSRPAQALGLHRYRAHGVRASKASKAAEGDAPRSKAAKANR